MFTANTKLNVMNATTIDVNVNEDYVRTVVGPAFDAKFYQRNYPGVASTEDAALSHYITTGWREGRWPNPDFDTAFYLAANPDVTASGCNPLLHFLLHGAYEGRRFRAPPKSPARRAVAAARPLREQAQSAQGLTDLPPVSRADLVRTLARSAGMVISVSHDQYWRVGGGVQNAVADEQRIADSHGWTYLHICPVRQLPMLADPMPAQSFEVAITVNGEPLGAATFDLVIDIAAAEARTRGEVKCVIHQLLGHVPELIQTLVIACRTPAPFVWTHDHFTLCPSFAMQRNNLTDCGGPPVNSPACQICNSGPERPDHVERIARFFATTRPVVLSPSDTFLNFWRSHTNMIYERSRVVPYCRIVLDSDATPAKPASRLRVGFLGAPAFRKGWEAFATLAERHAGDTRYEFIQLGWADPNAANVAHIFVKVSPDDRQAMVNAIAAAEIDVVVNWSLFFESFSFATIEAIAAGAFVIARRAAGNIWPLVSSINGARGLPIDTEYELQALFASGRVLELVFERDRRYGRLVIGSAIATVLFEQDTDTQ